MATKLMMLAAFVVVASARRFIRPMENPDLYHGDIAGEDNAGDRNAIKSKWSRWPNGVVVYSFDPGVSSFIPLIKKVMSHIEDTTCIRFEPHNGTQMGHIRIFSGLGCYSYWGRSGGSQPLSLGTGCRAFGVILHELLHAIGFDHEHNRSDRDDYLTILYNNIEPGAEDQFKKLLPEKNWLINAFDFDSIMIYGSTSFSKDGYSKTMVAKKRGVKFSGPYKKESLSPSDIERINILYECK